MAHSSALCPMMQFSWAPWRVLSKKALALVLDVAGLHKKMSGEIPDLVRESEVSGEPILRGLEYNYPGCGYEQVKDEFMRGSDILVCPVATPKTHEKDIILPEGKWVDEDGTVYADGKTVRIATSLKKLTWFRRA